MAERATRVDILFGMAYPDTRVRRTAHALSDAGYDVRVLAWDRSGELPATDRDGEVRIRHARVPSRSGRGWTQVLYLLRAVWRHLPAMRDERPDVLHVVDLPLLAGAIALRPFLGRPRIVFDAFEIYSLMEAHKYPAWLLRLLDAAERRLPRRADLVITPGEGRRAYFAERGIASTVVGNWIDPPSAGPDRAAARARLGIAADRTCVAYVGGLEASRDIGTLLRLARRDPDLEVVIAGRGEQEADVLAAAGELPNVQFLGWLADPGEVYAAADALYYALRPDHPYAAHPAPNTLYAAIAWAVPLLHRGQGEIGVLGQDVEVGASFADEDSLAAAVGLVRDPAWQRRVRADLRQLQPRFTMAAAARALVEAYPLGPRAGAPDADPPPEPQGLAAGEEDGSPSTYDRHSSS